MLWFDKLMVRFFMSLDTVLFNFIATLYDLLIAISRTSILTQGDIASFVTRIEILLGIFMLFKVSFSLITYVVNPDDFSDKSKGFGKLIQNSVISLVLLVLVPYIFQMAFNLQAKILDDNVLAKLLLGEKINDSTDSNATIIDTAGNQMAFYVMLPFFSPNYAVEGLSDCMTMVDSNGFTDACREALDNAGLHSPNLENYTYGIQNKSLGLTFRANTALAITNEAAEEGDNADQHFVIAYQKPLSTVTAVVVCLLLISFCIDIGVRSVKLAFLQLIYPIPVISYMDPKSGKDGMFSKWYKMCLSTFLSLFIRLLALYFGIYIITKVADFGMYDIINGSQITNGWVKIFVIIGVLMFVKQLPKILENMGIKLEGDGSFNLNPLKKVFDEKNGIAGAKAIKRTGIAAGAAGLAGAAAFGTNLIARKGNPFSAIAGAVSGARRGLMSGLKGEKLGKAYSSSYSGAMEARKSRAGRREDGVGWMEMQSSKFKQSAGMKTKGDVVKSANENIKKLQNTYDQMMNAAIGNDETANSVAGTGRLAGRTFNGLKDLSKFEEEIKKTSISRDNYATDSLYQDAVRAQQETLNDIDDMKKNRLNELASGAASTGNSSTDSAIQQGYSQMKTIASDINKATRSIDSTITEIDVTTEASKMNGVSKGVSSQVAVNKKANHAQVVDQYGSKKDQK